MKEIDQVIELNSLISNSGISNEDYNRCREIIADIVAKLANIPEDVGMPLSSYILEVKHINTRNKFGYKLLHHLDNTDYMATFWKRNAKPTEVLRRIIIEHNQSDLNDNDSEDGD